MSFASPDSVAVAQALRIFGGDAIYKQGAIKISGPGEKQQRRGHRLWMNSSTGVAKFLLKAFPRLDRVLEFITKHPDQDQRLAPGYRRLERALLWYQVINRYFHIRESAKYIAADFNGDRIKRYGKLGYESISVGGGVMLRRLRPPRFTKAYIDNVVRQIGYADAGSRLDRRPRTHGRRGRPKKALDFSIT